MDCTNSKKKTMPLYQKWEPLKMNLAFTYWPLIVMN